MAFGNTADLIFKIKADSTQAKREVNEMQTSIGNLGGKMSGLANPAAIAAAAVIGLGAAAVTLTKQLFDLTLQAAKYGAELQDIADKTGLTAASLSGLKYAAEQGGSSIEKASASVAKFNVLLGKAAEGNEKAQATLAKYNITATDTNEALAQAVKAIDGMASSTEKAAATAVLFKDRTGEMLPVIKAMNGDLDNATKRAQELGIALDDQTMAAAKRLDDTMLDLNLILKGVSLQLGSAMIPHVQRLADGLIRWATQNQAVIRTMATLVGTWMERFVNGALLAGRLVDALGRTISYLADRWGWLTSAIINSIPVLRVWLAFIERIHAIAARLANQGTVGAGMGGTFDTSRAVSFGGGGGGGGGGASGSNAKAEAERRERERIQAIMRNLSDELELRRAHDDKLQAELDAKLAREEITEEQALQKRRLIILAQLEFQRQALEDSANLIGENAEEYERIQRQLRVLAEETTTAQIEQSTKLYLLQKSLAEKTAAEVKAIFERLNSELIQANDALQAHYIESEERTWDELIANAVGFADEQNRIRAEAGDALELILRNELQRQLRRLETEKERRLKDAAEQIKDKEQLEQAKLEIEELFRKRSELLEEEFQERLKGIREKYAFKVTPEGDKKSIFGLGGFGEELEALGKNAFGAFANGIGSVVEQFVLLGKVGPDAMRKLTASVLAGLAAQAAVKSLFYLAEGFAALFTNPAQAAGYFKAAALMAIVAATAGAAGRAIAGNAFQQGTGGGAGTGRGGVAAGNGSDFDALSGGVFRGFGQSGQGSAVRRLEATLDRLDRTVAVTEKTIHDFATKVNGVSPGDVVMMGATDASREIRRAMENELANDSGTTDSYMRGMGLAR